ncbi:MAG: metalloregulator ArsR/SmtB family transcription factor [Candidatus Pacebacteria bacterium]|jgi:DNA-binding transcriptional ArsR family regulator|nr:metalloregulator ArsR/SmtB family transcription factor [Candidatus Paceibacterota bacterium]
MATKQKTNESIEALAKKLQTAGDINRLKILCYLFSAKKACVTDIADNIGMTVATASHHLQALAKEDLLASEREGKKICYKLGGAEINADLKKFICKYK